MPSLLVRDEYLSPLGGIPSFFVHNKLKHGLPDLNLVPVVEHFSGHRFFIQNGSVGAVKILQNEVPLSSLDTGMPPGRGHITERHMVVPDAPDKGRLRITGKLLPGVLPPDDDKLGRPLFGRQLFCVSGATDGHGMGFDILDLDGGLGFVHGLSPSEKSIESMQNKDHETTFEDSSIFSLLDSVHAASPSEAGESCSFGRTGNFGLNSRPSCARFDVDMGL